MATPNSPLATRHALLGWLRALTTATPPIVILLYETVRHQYFEHNFGTPYGNLAAAGLALALAFIFSHVVFGIVERLQADAVARGAELAALNAMVEEREQLSREVHDGSAQVLASVLLRVDSVQDLLAGGRVVAARAELERLRATADAAYAEARDDIAGLRTGLRKQSLAEAVRSLVDRFEERHEIVVDLRVDEVAERLGPIAQLQALRIVQEALANVRQHARARRARVCIETSEDGGLRVSVRDDGLGFDPAIGVDDGRQRFGLVTMRERAESVDGWLEVTSSPGAGTTVTVELPLVDARGGASAAHAAAVG